MMRFDKTLPKKIEMGYRVLELHSVEYDESLHSQMGLFETSKDCITVFVTGNTVDDSNTLIHEVLHAVYEQYALQDVGKMEDDKVKEERIVSQIADGLTEVFLRNPKVAEWIVKGTS